MKETSPTGIGIDVSKATLHVALRQTSQCATFIVPNTHEGIRELGNKLRGSSCPIVMESTGRYHLLSALLLSQKGFDIRVVNPIAAKRYISASVRKKKTDKADAIALADMAALHQSLPDRFCCSKRDIQIRQKMGLLCSLEKKLSSLRLMGHNYEEFQQSMCIRRSRAEYTLQQSIKTFDRQRRALQQEITKLINQSDLQQQHSIAVSIPGISPFVASILCHTLRFDCPSPKQWIAFMGLNIPPRESGTWKGKLKLSKRGNPYLRKRLYSAAWGAVMNHEGFRAYYDCLRQEGKCHVTALLVVARKLLCILHACQRDQTFFSEEKAFLR